jgi:hypothetical protein
VPSRARYELFTLLPAKLRRISLRFERLLFTRLIWDEPRHLVFANLWNSYRSTLNLLRHLTRNDNRFTPESIRRRLLALRIE